MNKKLILLLLICLSLYACSENDDEVGEQQKIPPQSAPTAEWESLLLGEWELVKQCETQTFGSGLACNTPYIDRYNFISNSVVFFDSFNNDCEEGSYDLKDRILSLQFECADLKYEAEIHTLTNSQLIFIFTGDDTALYRFYRKINAA